MKHLLLILFVACSLTAGAQEAPDTLIPRIPNHVELMDSVFRHLDKSRIPHGILYDRVSSYALLPELHAGDNAPALTSVK